MSGLIHKLQQTAVELSAEDPAFAAEYQDYRAEQMSHPQIIFPEEEYAADVAQYAADHADEKGLSLLTLNPYNLLDDAWSHTSLFKSDYQKQVAAAAGHPLKGASEFKDEYFQVYSNLPQDILNLGNGVIPDIGNRLGNEAEKLVIIAMVIAAGGLITYGLINKALPF